MWSASIILLFIATEFASSSDVSGSRPNIIFILSDDLGYGDYSISDQVKPASTRIPTPNIARMAKNGMKFSRGYSGQVCAPSRTMLMTGRHLGHTTIRGNDGAYTPLLPTDVTVAKVLKDAGYTTGLIGKWGLGNFGTSGYPNAQGFDHFVGQDTQVGCHNWYPLTVCNDSVHNAPLNTKKDLAFVECLGPHATCTWANDLDRTAGVTFIRDAHAKAKPFFLYLSSTTPHAGQLEGTGPKPPLYSSYNPVPYPYNTKFENKSAADGWTVKEKLFASAVWAQDVMVGAVLDEIEALGIENNTVVFFSGDNGPDIPGKLFDDAGFFRGKKRSLHEGGIRQTIVVQWVGTIAPNSVSDDLFIFYDLLPTAADLAGVPRANWPATDGLSAVPIFAASRPGQTTRLDPTLTPHDPTLTPHAHRFLYYEFCHNGMVDGLLRQSYASGWGQAVRFDDNETEYETQWKAIAVNSNYSNILLYNLTDDQSESVVLAGTPVGGSDVTVHQGPPGPAVQRALAHATDLFISQHVENPYWKSSKNASDRCCASCFSPQGCNYPCKRIGPAPAPPAPPSPPGAPIAASALVGNWTAEEGNGRHATFMVSVDASSGHDVVTLRNPSDSTSCWSSGHGGWDNATNTITNVVCSGCNRQATGQVRARKRRRVMDHDYVYEADFLELEWQVRQPKGRGHWPSWTKKITGYTIVMDK